METTSAGRLDSGINASAHTADLGGPILRSVSRSFYLSICVLPKPLRAPVGLAYLLARASDTIADSGELPGTEREEHLRTFLAVVNGAPIDQLRLVKERVRSDHEGENALIARLDECIAWLAALPEFDRGEVRRVLVEIVKGQSLDVQRFDSPDRLRALQTADELEEYTYLVAGCVGEFWTRVCLHHLPGYTPIDSARLIELGKNFGKALQLVNILRDLPGDLRKGRCYLPSSEVDAASILTAPSSAKASFEKWHARACELLESGREYIRAIRPRRVRFACFLPWDLARKTLDRLAVSYPLETATRIKVSRSDVRATMFSGAICAFSDAPLS